MRHFRMACRQYKNRSALCKARGICIGRKSDRKYVFASLRNAFRCRMENQHVRLPQGLQQNFRIGKFLLDLLPIMQFTKDKVCSKTKNCSCDRHILYKHIYF
jgi:hypothetical protein